MTSLIIRASAVWLVLVILAIINGTIREKILVPLFGGPFALPASGLLLTAAIFGLIIGLFPFIGIADSSDAWLVGGIWLLLTVLFEVLFGHFVAGDSWSKLLKAYDISTGNLWILVLLATVGSPYLAGKLRGLI